MSSRPFRPLGLPIYVARVPTAPFTRRYPRDFTFYVTDPVSSIETRSLPTLTRSYPRRFTFYVADPSAPLKLVRCPRSLAPTLVALPSMSLIRQLYSPLRADAVKRQS
jgi:hypothetical protein